METLTIEDIANKYSLSLLLTFGSYNTERYTKDSDIDVGFISKVILDVDRPPASDYFNSFIDVAECGVIDMDFAVGIAPSSGLRNRLVHEYEKINDEIVYSSID